MEIRILPFRSPEQQASVVLRDLVLRQPLRLSFTQEELDEEGDQIHIGAVEKDAVYGVLLLKPLTDGRIKMRQVAVDTAQQGKGIGHLMVAFAERWCAANGYHTVELHARLVAVSFYLHQQYVAEGDLFEEVGIPHLKMLKTINPRLT